MKKNHRHTPEASDFPGDGERFRLPPDVSFYKQPRGDSWAYVFRHRTLGEIGRILFQGTTGGKCLVSYEVVGDPADPMTAERAAIFKPLGIELAERMAAATGPVWEDSIGDPLPRPPESLEMIESKHIPCEQCRSMAAMLIFAPDATDPGRFEDYARKIYPHYVRLNLPTWIIGPPIGNKPPMDCPSDILKIWPAREPIRRLTPAEFNLMLDRVTDGHCGPAPPEPVRAKRSSAVNAEMLGIAVNIHARVLRLILEGCDDVTIFTKMGDAMPDFKRVIDTAGREVLDELYERFDGFYHYAQILEDIATGITSGDIVVP